jgi:hypothetical protein
VQSGVLFFEGRRLARIPASGRGNVWLEYLPVPAQEVLGAVNKLASAAPGWEVGDTPVRGLALAVNSKAGCFGLDNETVMLKLAIPIRDIVPVGVT